MWTSNRLFHLWQHWHTAYFHWIALEMKWENRSLSRYLVVVHGIYSFFCPSSVSRFFTLCRVASRDKNCREVAFIHTRTMCYDFSLCPKDSDKKQQTQNKTNTIWYDTIKINASQQSEMAYFCDELYRKVFMAPMCATHQTTQQFGMQYWWYF